MLLAAERPAIPILAVRASCRAGAVPDPSDKAGLAGLTGSLLTRGTAKRSGPELDSAIEFVGGSLEAGAGRDGLSVSLGVLKRDLALGLDLMAEVILSPTFPEAEFKRKVAQTQAAIKRSEEDPGTVAGRALAPLVFPGHPYGRPAEGTVESVGRITRDDVVRFHREQVRPDTTIIGVVGAVTLAEARREILARFGGWTKPSGPAASVPEAAPAGRRRTAHQERYHAGDAALRPAGHPPDRSRVLPLAVASYVLGGGSPRACTSACATRAAGLRVYAYPNPAVTAPRRGLGGDADGRGGEGDRPVREELARMGREPSATGS